MLMLIKPEEIDFETMLMGDEAPTDIEDFTALMRDVEGQGSKLVTVYDCEGDAICIAPIEIAKWLIDLMNNHTALPRIKE